MFGRQSTQAVTRNQFNKCDLCQKSTLKLDFYRQPVELRLPDETGKYRTFLGAMLSIATLVTVVLFSSYKLITLINFQDFDI